MSTGDLVILWCLQVLFSRFLYARFNYASCPHILNRFFLKIIYMYKNKMLIFVASTQMSLFSSTVNGIKLKILQRSAVVQACHPSYSGDGDWEVQFMASEDELKRPPSKQMTEDCGAYLSFQLSGRSTYWRTSVQAGPGIK
jgi:hypothetical protein